MPLLPHRLCAHTDLQLAPGVICAVGFIPVGVAAALLPAVTSHSSLLRPEGFSQDTGLWMLKPTKSQASQVELFTLSPAEVFKGFTQNAFALRE